MTIPQIAVFQRVRMKRLEAKQKAYEQARKNAARDTGNIRTSLEAYTARQAQAAEEEDDA
jgi:hypothetical protein